MKLFLMLPDARYCTAHLPYDTDLLCLPDIEVLKMSLSRIYHDHLATASLLR